MMKITECIACHQPIEFDDPYVRVRSIKLCLPCYEWRHLVEPTPEQIASGIVDRAMERARKVLK